LSLSAHPRRPPSSFRSCCLRRIKQRKRERRLLPPLPAVEGTAPPPPPKMPAQLRGIVAAGLATRKRGEQSSWCEPSRCRYSST
jgi:hypothetical protein